MKTSTSAYIHSLTPLRGIAAIWVVVYHIDWLTTFAGLSNIIPKTSTMLLAKGYLWVDFFFLLSGFIMAHVYGKAFMEGISYEKVKPYILARFARLYPLHLFCLLMHIIAFAVLLLVFPLAIDKVRHFFPWEAIPLHLVMGQAWGSPLGLTWNPPAWSIGAEWWTYLIAIGLFPLIYGRKNWKLLIISGLCIAALACVIAVNKKHSLDATYNFGMLRCLSEFTLGIVLHQLYDKKIGENLLKKDISFFITVCLILTVMHYSWIDILIIPCFTCLILAAAYNRQSVQNLLRKRPMVFLGEISFSLYMTQAFWLNIYLVSLHVWADTFPGQDLSLKVKLFWLIIILAANILSAVFTHHYVEIPARNWIKKKTLQPVMAKVA